MCRRRNDREKIDSEKWEEQKKSVEMDSSLLEELMQIGSAVEQVPIETQVSNADELMKYAELFEKGFLTEEEFTAVKKKLLDF